MTMIKLKSPLKLFVFLWFWVLALIFMAGCTVSSETLPQLETTAKTAPLIIVATTNQPVSEIETTPTEIKTPLLPATTSSPTTMPLPTLLPVSTLSIEQEALLEDNAELLQELMQTNGGCQLPCWWGTELGENTASVNEKFINYGISLWYIPSNFEGIDEQGYVHLGYYNPTTLGDDVSVTTDFRFVDGKVQFIDALVERPLRQYGEEKLLRDWEKYSISSMLQQYGLPPYVYLFPQNVTEAELLNFSLLMYYPELGYKFEYEPYNISSGETQAELCLNLDNMRFINLSLYNPEFVNLRPKYLLPPALNPEADDFIQAWTWESVTGMDLDMFYEIYKDSSSPECIQIGQ